MFLIQPDMVSIATGELVQENTCLRNRNQELERDNNQIRATNENLTRLNDVLKIVLRDTEDQRDHFKALNIEEFDNFISNYIFSLFNNIGTLFQFDNQYTTNIKVFVARLRGSYVNLTEMK
ncbi:27938_t:CDS:2 [Racocetra persica]|uniref:27938_t:CDS:1 n=1 Tax=Racocetra persica TaxID=160502 RepID=A0ACA9M5J1_9GLOM|nr:27938_t:CDS:2 [Racocetra persica]